MKALLWTIVVIVVAVILYFVFAHGSANPTATITPTETTSVTEMPSMSMSPTPTATTTSGVTRTPTAIPRPSTSASVNIQNFAFSPSTFTIKKGTKVTWTNHDSVAHTVTSDSGATLSSGSIAPGQSFSFTFNTVGTFPYHCAFHPSMTGSVTVTN